MKRVLITITLLVACLSSFGQLIFIGSTEEQIKSKLPTITKAIFDETTYNNGGDKITLFKFPYEDELLTALFIFGDNGLCKKCTYYFKHDSNINYYVQSIKNNSEWMKVPDLFAFVNTKTEVVMEFKRNGNDKSFQIDYYPLP